MSEEEKYENGLRWLAWGFFWILCNYALLATLFLLYGLMILLMFAGIIGLYTEFSPNPKPNVFELFFWLLSFVAYIGFFVTHPLGLVCCCFCPPRLVKRAWAYVAGSVGLMAAAVVVGFMNMYSLNVQLSVIGLLIWQIFLLRLAWVMKCMTAERLAWGIMVWVVVSAGVWFVFIHEFPDYFEAAVPCGIAVVGYVVLHAVLLEMLRRKVKSV